MKEEKSKAIEINNFVPFSLKSAKVEHFSKFYSRINGGYEKIGAIDNYIELRENLIDFDEERNLFILKGEEKIRDMFENFAKDYFSKDKKFIKERFFYFEMTCVAECAYLDEHELIKIETPIKEFSISLFSENLNKYIAQGLPKVFYFEAKEFEVISYLSYKYKAKEAAINSTNLFKLTLSFEGGKDVF
ncbi:hypothetical protein YS40_119 [Thermus phage phiYS40]|uniref:hypothetical protein n=1 Tax=Thermus phage phiYS40 TaxID=407392 RepID=UPI0000E689ED|nr:hypothetical protein YS40_119 [Thermus phage phiYS40]ABJ91513.1 hypothetical protein YS40_119 [Thermus phage phiYS40]BAK53637.1 hypothetical protein YSP_119 [Thermus phage phiYS40]